MKRNATAVVAVTSRMARLEDKRSEPESDIIHKVPSTFGMQSVAVGVSSVVAEKSPLLESMRSFSTTTLYGERERSVWETVTTSPLIAQRRTIVSRSLLSWLSISMLLMMPVYWMERDSGSHAILPLLMYVLVKPQLHWFSIACVMCCRICSLIWTWLMICVVGESYILSLLNL